MAPPVAPSPASKPKRARQRRIGAGLGALALVVVILVGLQWYRGHQLTTSCTGNGGQWDAERQACTFGGDTRIPSPPEPAPQ